MNQKNAHAPAGRELWERLPDFAHALRSHPEALRTASAALLVLGLWAAAVWSALFVLVSRLQPSA